VSQAEAPDSAVIEIQVKGGVMENRLHIAIADDDCVCRDFLNYALRRMGHEVVCLAENGRELVDYCLQSPPELVITDVQMPELDGITAAAEITWQHNVPVVLISGNCLPAHIESLSHVRVLVRRVKPVSGGDLEKILAEVAALTDAAAAISLNQPIVEGGQDDGSFHCSPQRGPGGIARLLWNDGHRQGAPLQRRPVCDRRPVPVGRQLPRDFVA
jgi:CheY-like chemotaxis protein